ncbi:MAG: radical SAM protein [Bacteroidales bacterium]|nr:radical SAM protein [Bacteroidales bacterium]MCF8327721.1 radical SAM protein [Bacteroidales bacterium]
MPGILYDSIVYGPVNSRRFGISLGINVLPENSKVCSFDCIYCEVGWNSDFPSNHSNQQFHAREDIYHSLKERLIDLKERHMIPDNITFSGNGEPTMHPEFSNIVEDIKKIRDQYVPDTHITVLSNSTTLNNKSVFDTLLHIENNIMKLDAGSENMFRLINQPVDNIHIEDIVENLKIFNGKLFIQSMFLRGEHRGEPIDNTTKEEVQKWLDHIKAINPKGVLLYSIDRATPNHTIEKVQYEELERIANQVRHLGIEANSFS